MDLGATEKRLPKLPKLPKTLSCPFLSRRVKNRLTLVDVCVIGPLSKAKGQRMKIDKHIPPPQLAGRKYPFRDMQPGDSVFFVGENRADKHHPAYASARNYVKRHGWRIAVRTVVEDGRRGIRIWRVE